MSMRTLLARWAAVLGIAAMALPAVNCFGSSPPVMTMVIFGGLAGSPNKATVVLRNHYVGVRAKKNNTGFTLRSTRTLWPPFRIEGTLGLFDPKHAALDDHGFGMSVISFQSNGFAGATIRRVDAGISITGDLGATTGTTLTLPTSLLGDVAISHDGANLIVEARGPGGGAFQELGRVAATAAAFQVSLDAGPLPYRTLVAYDELRVVSVGRRPGLSPIETLREDVFVACDALADALAQLDGSEQDAVAAKARLTTARDELAAVVLAAPTSGASTKARRAIAGAQKRVSTALAALEKGKKPTTYYNLVYAAARALVLSTDQVK